MSYMWGMPPTGAWPAQTPYGAPSHLAPPPQPGPPAPPPQTAGVYPPSPAASPLGSPFIPPAFIESPVLAPVEVSVQPGVQATVQPSVNPGVHPPSPGSYGAYLSPPQAAQPQLYPGNPLFIPPFGANPYLTPMGTPYGSPYNMTPPTGSPWAPPGAASAPTPYFAPPPLAPSTSGSQTPFVPPLATPLTIPPALTPPSPPSVPSAPSDVQIAPWLTAGTLRWEPHLSPRKAKYCSSKGVYLPLEPKMDEDATWPLPEPGATLRLGDALAHELWGAVPLPDDDAGASTGGILAAAHAFLQKAVRSDEVPRIKEEDGKWDAAVRAMADRCRNSSGLPEAEWAKGMRRVDVLGGKACVGLVAEGEDDGWGLVLVLEG